MIRDPAVGVDAAVVVIAAGVVRRCRRGRDRRNTPGDHMSRIEPRALGVLADEPAQRIGELPVEAQGRRDPLAESRFDAIAVALADKHRRDIESR